MYLHSMYIYIYTYYTYRKWTDHQNSGHEICALQDEQRDVTPQEIQHHQAVEPSAKKTIRKGWISSAKMLISYISMVISPGKMVIFHDI